jgi:predicted metal-binding protein
MKRTVRADWQAVVLVCGKCTRKVKGGFGADGRTSLDKALRKFAGKGKGKGRKAPVGVYEVPCLKVCPKQAVTVVDGAHPDKWLIVPAGTPVARIAVQLGIAGLDPAKAQPAA